MTMFNKIVKEFKWGQHNVRLETGEIARQASGAVIVDIEDTVVLATVVGAKTAKPGQDFFPLTVDYIEKTYAAGKIPGSFFKREGRPSEARNADLAPDRPSAAPAVPRRLLQRSAGRHPRPVAEPGNRRRHPRADRRVGAALAVSGIPFNGPIGAARVGYINGEYVLNPTQDRRCKESQLDLIVAGTEARRADGRIGSRAAERRSDARRRGVRPRAEQDRHRRDPRTGARRRQAGVGLASRRRRTKR